jgi:dihydroorotate dehydrogenase
VIPVSAYTTLVRPLLFRVSPERAHDLARVALRLPGVWSAAGPFLRTSDPRLRTDLCGLHLATPIGLAPGLDKDADLLRGLDHLGFGYLVVGSITPEPRAGNPRPRLVRYPDRRSIANSMGLPSVGLDEAVRRLRASRTKTPVIGSVCGFTAEEVASAAAAVEPYVAAVEIGLICPNSSESERMKSLDTFGGLVTTLRRHRTKPVFVKLPSYSDDSERTWVLALVDACLAAGIDGLSVSGSRPVTEPRLATGRGSLAGRDVFAESVALVGEISAKVAGAMPIRAAGGVFSGADALAMLDAGATTVEIYSAFVYRGWGAAHQIAAELSALLPARDRAARAEAAPAPAETP